MKTWEEVVGDRRRRYIDTLRKAEELTLAQSAIDELRMVLESCVPVVRCRDCKNYGGGDVEHEYDRCRHHWSAVEEDDYCSFGERR